MSLRQHTIGLGDAAAATDFRWSGVYSPSSVDRPWQLEVDLTRVGCFGTVAIELRSIGAGRPDEPVHPSKLWSATGSSGVAIATPPVAVARLGFTARCLGSRSEV